jgi:drug/metabolite transporter (DMT)-like permease
LSFSVPEFKATMRQTLIGLGISVVGLLMIVFSERLAQMTSAINQAYGLVIPPRWGRAINIVTGVLWLLGGLFMAFHLTSGPSP